MENLRIGFTGPSGSGKTTLATWLAKEKGIPFIASSASLMISDEDRDRLHRLYGYNAQGHKAVIALSNTNPQFGIDFQLALVTQRVRLLMDEVSKGNPFIVDRTMIDNIVYFLSQCGPHATEDQTKMHITYCIERLYQIFTHLFAIQPNDNWTENNGSRVNNNYWQNLTVWPSFKAVFEKVAAERDHHSDPKFIQINFWDLNLRKQTIIESIYG